MQASVCVCVCECVRDCVSVCVLGHYAGNVTYLKFMYFLTKRLAKSKALRKRKTTNRERAPKKKGKHSDL